VNAAIVRSAAILGAVCMTLTAGLASAQAAAGKPTIFSPEPIYDFGNRDSEQDVVHEFSIVNLGTAPLEIKDVRTSCGCTVADLEKRILQPGEETHLGSTLKLQGRQGPQNRTITVTSNDPDNPTYQLGFKGTAMAAVMYDPQFINLGRVVDETLYTEKVSVKAGTDDVTFNVIGVESTLSEIETEVVTIEEGRSYEIIARNTEPFKEGNLNGMITIHTDYAKRPSYQVRFFAQVIGGIEVRPDSLTLQQTNDPERTTTQFIRVAPGRIKSFNITEVIAPLPTIDVQIVAQGNSNFNVQVANMPGDESLDGQHLIIKTDSEEVPEVKVPFRIIKPVSQLPAAARAN
jgi:hypothetical protein